MIAIPYRTDAPVYHFPHVTVGLIAVNTLAYLMSRDASAETLIKYVLLYGDGLHPLQWVTSNFIHGGLMHLLGNMIFLWTFGLIVEGKVGPLPFLGIYLGIGFVECGLEQVLMRNSLGASFGASSILFGLLAMALVWAPRNEVGVCGLIVVRPFAVELSLLWFVPLLLAEQLLIASL